MGAPGKLAAQAVLKDRERARSKAHGGARAGTGRDAALAARS